MSGQENDLRRVLPVWRAVTVGGGSKGELRGRLGRAGVALNGYAEELFASGLFVVSEKRYSLDIVETSVEGLGFAQGAAMGEILARAGSLGLGLCPLELGPWLRLEYLDQPEGNAGQPARPGQAPAGAITIVSAALAGDDGFPKGLYFAAYRRRAVAAGVPLRPRPCLVPGRPAHFCGLGPLPINKNPTRP